MESGFIVAVAVGAGVAVQVAILGRQSSSLHPLAISLGLQVAGVLIGGMWAIAQRAWPEVGVVAGQWWWIPLGALGWLLVAALGFASARIGVAPTLASAVAGQLLLGLWFDARAGNVEIGVQTAAGAGFLLIGVVLVAGRG